MLTYNNEPRYNNKYNRWLINNIYIQEQAFNLEIIEVYHSRFHLNNKRNHKQSEKLATNATREIRNESKIADKTSDWR